MYLHGHEDVCGLVQDFADSSIKTLAEFVLEKELGHVDSEGSAATKIDAFCMKYSLVCEAQGT